MKESIIITDKLCKTFSSGGIQQHVLKNLDLEIYKGDYTVIMGASGAGKSTLLYALSGMDTPSLGKVIFASKEISSYTSNQLAIFRRKHCGFVFQQIYLLDTMSILDNILASGYLGKRKRKDIIKEAKELLQAVGLEALQYQKFPSQLSGGESQRAAVVRALINTPEVVFVDEPTGQLNSSASKAVLDVLSNVNEKGQSIVMVTHDIKSALRGNRIIYLQDGTIVGECQLGQYQEDDDTRRTKLLQFLQEMGW